MPICIECRYPLKTLYTTYSKADDRALGKGVRLTQCPRCKRFGDKYVEHDFVVLFIDLVLIKPQVYRHLLFNRLGRDDDRFDPSIIRLGILLLLFDVYLTWARIEKASPSPSSSSIDPQHQRFYDSEPSLLSTQPLMLQYLFFLALCTMQTLAFHLPIRLLCKHSPLLWLPSWFGGKSILPGTAAGTTATTTITNGNQPAAGNGIPASVTSVSGASTSTGPSRPSMGLIPYYPHPTPLSTALLVSSCTKLFPLLLIIWDYDLPSSASAVSWAVIVNNIAALEILMDCGYLRAGLLVGIGAAVRAVVGEAVLSAVGLGGGAGGWKELGWGFWSK